ncbi:MAG: MFS transporter, partial [Actinobacteria bacterium ATB1]|nr:MFS transporter [Actinobacteria bacterium ATB1]
MAQSPETIHHRRWVILGVLCLSLVLVVINNSVLNVAIPTMVRALRAPFSQMQWIVDAYALVFGGLLLTAGTLGDRFGRKPALQIGLLVIGIFSGMSAFATQPEQLIATRALMGAGAAFVMPATLSILTNVFPPGERGKAIGIWAAFAGIG